MRKEKIFAALLLTAVVSLIHETEAAKNEVLLDTENEILDEEISEEELAEYLRTVANNLQDQDLRETIQSFLNEDEPLNEFLRINIEALAQTWGGHSRSELESIIKKTENAAITDDLINN